MKRIIAVVACTAALATTQAFAEVSLSLSVGQPGFYGQIDIGGYPQPQVLYTQPVVVVPGPELGPPIYLHVPRGYDKHWKEHCHEYNACNRRVMFVKDSWYNNSYVPHYREHNPVRAEEHREVRQDNRHEESRHEEGRHEERRGEERGREEQR